MDPIRKNKNPYQTAASCGKYSPNLPGAHHPNTYRVLRALHLPCPWGLGVSELQPHILESGLAWQAQREQQSPWELLPWQNKALVMRGNPPCCIHAAAAALGKGLPFRAVPEPARGAKGTKFPWDSSRSQPPALLPQALPGISLGTASVVGPCVKGRSAEGWGLIRKLIINGSYTAQSSQGAKAAGNTPWS